MAALRLHRQMLSDGIDSRFLYSKDDRQTNQTQAIQNASQIQWVEPKIPTGFFANYREKRRVKKIFSLYDRHIAERSSDLELVSMPSLEEKTAHNLFAEKSNLVHLHWLAFMVDYPSFFAGIPDSVPIVWTLHDMNPFTGGCHYSNGCERFAVGCGACPLIENPGRSDVSRFGFKIKQQAFKNKNIHVVAPSRWIKDLAARSSIFPSSTIFHHIRLGFDLQQFCLLYTSPSPRDQRGSRMPSSA